MDTVIAAYAISGNDESGSVVTVRGGAEVPGDHPLVKAAPAVFVLKGTPKHSWPSPWEESNKFLGQQEANRQASKGAEEEWRRQANPRRHFDPSTPISDLRRATQTILSSQWGSIHAGEVRHMDDPIVVNLPAYFEALAL